MIGYSPDVITPSIKHVDQQMQLKPWTPIDHRHMTLTSVPNTQISCRFCGGSKIGNGFVVLSHRQAFTGGPIRSGDLVPCPVCNGTKIQMSTHQDELWGMNR